MFAINKTSPYSAKKLKYQTPNVDDEDSLSMNMWVIFSSYLEQGVNPFLNLLPKFCKFPTQ